MPTLLHLDASPRETSISRELTREFASTWKAAHPDGRVIYRDLAANPPALISQAWWEATFKAPAERSAEQNALLALSETLIQELEAANEIVIGVPMHNFSVPAALKLWIDQIVRRGRTFSYGADGPKGLLTGKKATLLAASGGVYSPDSPLAVLNFVEPYLKAVLGFVGIADIRTVAVGGVARLSSGAIDRVTLLEPALQQIRTTAA
jgi:FMN-dependent NADH-azoreductase